MTQFLLNDQAVTLAHEQAGLSVLEYLRQHAHKYGTKEGCASGDCGACTVVVASVDGGSLRYEAINSCIAFAGSLHGKQLLSVDDLADGADLHPVQQAMVDYHASQCGFCTPGFVMSLFSLYKNLDRERGGGAGAGTELRPGPGPGRPLVEEYLGGNLCRCTGYKPIIAAALAATRAPQPDHFSRNEAAVAAALRAIPKQPAAPAPGAGVQTPFYHPLSLKQLAALIERYPEARLLAGGTDLALEMTQQLKTLPAIIYLGAVRELREIKEDKHAYRIGAAVNLVQCQQLLSAGYPELGPLLARFGSRQIRLRGTLAGNVANASPIGDMPPVLIALEAQLELQRGGARRTLAVEDYFIDYKKTALQRGEFIRAVLIPKPKQDHQLKIYKISKRLDDDISAVCAVFHIRNGDGLIHEVRAAFGGMAATPKRAPACEEGLRGQPLEMQTIRRAQQALATDFQPIDDMRASAAYRMQVAQNLLEKLYIELSDSAVATRVTNHNA